VRRDIEILAIAPVPLNIILPRVTHPILRKRNIRWLGCTPFVIIDAFLVENNPVAIIKHRTEFHGAILARLSSTIILLVNWGPEPPIIPR
jgi:hypothetical protein